jgi:anti-sigma factor RsiW
MTVSNERISNEQISAWVDGELDAVERDRIQAWLHDHPQELALAQAWADDRAALAAAFGPVLAEPVPEALLATVARRPSTETAPRWLMAAAAAGLLVAGALLGGGGVWQWQSRLQQQRLAEQVSIQLTQQAAGTAAGWVQRAAFAHTVYVAESRHVVEVKAHEEHLSRWLTRRIEIPVKLFDLREQGFELVGGRLLPDGPGKSAQLMYQDAQQRRVTVYLRKPDKGTDAAFRYEQQGRLGMFYWIESGAGYALAGELPKATLLDLAQAIYKQHPGVLPEAPAAPASAASAPR